MHKQGSRGTITLLVLLVIFALIGLLVYKLMDTDYFNVNGSYILTEAGKVSIEQFKKECKYYGYMNVVENTEEYESKPIRYNGVIEAVKKETFGGYSVKVKVTIPDEEVCKINKETTPHNEDNTVYYKYIIVSIAEDKQLQAVTKDKVTVYGYIDKIDEAKENEMIHIKGTRIIKRDT